MEILPIIDEEGTVVGKEDRATVHEKGLLHPEVHVLMLLPNGKFVFQRRSMSKNSNPGKLTVSVGGHVSYGQTIAEAVVRETEEETGVSVSIEELSFLGKVASRKVDQMTGLINNSLKYFYGYRFTGSLSDLRVEKEDGAGFEEYSLDELLALPEDTKKEFVEVIFRADVISLFEKMLHS